MNRSLIFSFILLFILGTNCEKENNPDCQNVGCSKEFLLIGLNLLHESDNSPVILTSYKVLRFSDNKDITHSSRVIEGYTFMGFYPLVDDSDKETLRNKNVEIEFQGFIDNNLIVTKRFVVTADCCHISKISGESTVYI